MANVETLEGLERRVTISLPKDAVQKEMDVRIGKIAKDVRMPGFRPGKAPLKMVARQYAGEIENEVLDEKVGEALFELAREQKLRVAGRPVVNPKEDADNEGAYEFTATFEVYPEVKIGDVSSLEIERAQTAITETEIDRTVDILRKQRMLFHVRGEAGPQGDGGADTSAQDGDRVMVDFTGKLDGEVFQGGSAEDFLFVVGEGRMLPEFENAALGLKAGEAREFDLTFPDDYPGTEVAGKKTQFTITVKKVEWPHQPPVDAEFAKLLGVEDGDVVKMRADIKENLEREAKHRTQAITRTRVMDALLKIAEFDVPKVLVMHEQQRLAEEMRQNLIDRGMTHAKDAPIPTEMFHEQAERRVKLGLLLAELINTHSLQARPEQIRAEIEDRAKSYENPKEIVRWFYSSKEQLAGMEAYVAESNVVDFVLGQAKVTDRELSFEELANVIAPEQA
jgi:trigger factor